MTVAINTSRVSVYAGFVKLEHTIFSLPLIFAGALLGARSWSQHLPGFIAGEPSFRAVFSAPVIGWPHHLLANQRLAPEGPGLLSAILQQVVGWILLAAVGARVTAMGLNRLIDAELDRRNPRTKSRELARGAMHSWEGWLLVLIAGALYLLSAAAIAPICLQLSPIPLALFVIYPYLKRFTSLAHLGLGLAWSMAPLGGWLAVSKSLAGIGDVGWLWLFSVLWVTGFDIIYATMDIDFDRVEGLHSIPAWIGQPNALRLATMLHIAAFAMLIMLWRAQLHSAASLLCLAPIAALFIWQHRISERNPAFAFFQLNALLGFLVFGFVLAGT